MDVDEPDTVVVPRGVVQAHGGELARFGERPAVFDRFAGHIRPEIDSVDRAYVADFLREVDAEGAAVRRLDVSGADAQERRCKRGRPFENVG